MKLDHAIDNLNRVTSSTYYILRAALRALVDSARISDRTGLRNSLAFDEALANLQHDEGSHLLLFGDLDGFKAINDAHTHEAGDVALERVGHILGLITSDCNATAYHISGDEFAIIVPKLSKDRLLAQLQQHLASIACEFGDKHIEFSASFGCTEIDALDLEQSKARAEAACQMAKRAGQAKVVHEWTSTDRLDEIERRLRCRSCGTSFWCTLTGEHRGLQTLHCPVCRAPTIPPN